MLRHFSILPLALLLHTLPSRVVADQILKTTGFDTCLQNSTITVQNVDVEYNNDNKVSAVVATNLDRIRSLPVHLLPSSTAYSSNQERPLASTGVSRYMPSRIAGNCLLESLYQATFSLETTNLPIWEQNGN